MSANQGNDYHQLLARHHAMQFRKQMLSSGHQPSSPAADSPFANPYSDAEQARADQQLIKQNLHLVAPLGGVIQGLYEAMFRHRPYLRSLFPDSMDFQQDRLAQSLGYLIERLDRPQEVRENFTQLGRDHRKLGVWPVHYETFQTALRESLRRRAGQRWNAEVEEAWMRMLEFAVDAMLGGAQAAVTEPPYWHSVVVEHERRLPGLAILRLRPNGPYTYRPGQYGALESPLLPHTWRQYSMARAPRPDGLVEFHVRLTHPGGVSAALVEDTRVGDTLRLGPANGTMTLDEEITRDLLLVAGGTGLAPIRAILDELSTRRLGGRRVHLFVGARNRAELYDWEALADLEGRSGWLTVVPVLSEESWYSGETGMLADAVGRYGDWSQHLSYVSGPPKMVDTTVMRLQEMHTPLERIRYDPLPGVLRG